MPVVRLFFLTVTAEESGAIAESGATSVSLSA
jgi:hypothetical protein